MQQIGTYLLSVIAAALFTSICANILPPKSTVGVITKLVCGILLMTVIITPVSKLHFDDFQSFYRSIKLDADSYVEEGTALTKSHLAESIKKNTEAYIFDKAADLHLDLSLEVSLNQEDIPVPESIRISGNISPYAKSKLSQIITRDLNIAEENIQWN